MKTKVFILSILVLVSNLVDAQPAYLKNVGGTQRLMVNGKPFIMVAGELHNSTSSTYEYLSTTWASLRAMHLNSVIATVAWEQLEPEEGKFDFEMVDSIISLATRYQMPTAIAWFGTWKNSESSYAPLWVKKDTKRFFRARNKDGEATSVISPFCEEACKADIKAYTKLMQHIKERDTQHYIALMQVENEVGVFGEMDFGKQAQEAFNQEVPANVMTYLKKNRSLLNPELKKIWTDAGQKSKGSWKEVFGDNVYGRHTFIAWAYAAYCERVAKAGKEVYPLPAFMNAALLPPGLSPGLGFNGCPVPNVIDIYKATAPSVDFCAPDIYLPLFKHFCKEFHRPDNPLFIPETIRDAAQAYYAFAEHDAICYSPFAIEDAYLDKELVATYQVLNELLPTISKYQGSGKMHGFVRENEETDTTLQMGNYDIEVHYVKEERKAFGMIIQTADDEFIVSGVGAMLTFKSHNPKLNTKFAQIHEGRLDGEKWTTTCWLNGDQSVSYNVLYLRGRVNYTDKLKPEAGEVFPMPNVAVNETQKPIVIERLKTPGIYKAKVYSYLK